MKPGIPWSVKGIEPEAREAAKDAARRSGMTLGEWLNSVILDQSDGAQQVAGRHGDAAPKEFSTDEEPFEDSNDTTIRLEDIAQQLTRLAQRDQQSAAIRAYAPPGRQRQDVESINRILSRLDGNERQTANALSAVDERLSILGNQISQVAERKPEDVPGYQALETALRNIVDHIEVSEKRTRESLKAMQDRMGDMTQRAGDSAFAQEAFPAFNDLEIRLNELVRRIERTEASTNAGLPDLVRQELGQLAERVEQVRQASESFAAKAQSSAVQAAQAELHEIESRIFGLLKEAQSALSDSAGNAAEIQRVRAEIGSLNQRIDDAKTDAASERDVHALRIAFEQLSARAAQGPDLRPLADMDRRLADVALKLEQSQAEARNLPQLGDLERRFAELDRRLTDALQSKDDSRAVAALEQQIAAVDERVARTEQQLGHLETIERAITQLYESVDQNRNMAREIAEDAVNRMAERFTGMQAPAEGPSPELQALEEGLRAVGETAASAESRNQETLQAVHETLEQIVVKLSELETASAGHKLALAMVQQATARAPEPQIHLQQQPEPSQPPEPVPAEPYEPQPAASPPVTHNFEKHVPPVAAMPPHLAASALDPVAGDDYINAARRAAHAAVHNVDFIEATAALEAGRKAVGRKSKFKLPFLKPKAGVRPKIEPPAEIRPVPILRAPDDTAGKRRKLLIAGIVLLAAVSALTFTMLGRSSKPPQSGAIEGTVKTRAELPTMPGASVSAFFIDPIAAAASELFTGSLPPRRDPSLTPIVSEKKAATTLVEMPPETIGSESLRRAAAAGDAVAQFIVAGRYLDGKPVPQDFAKAAYWYREAAARGLAPAQYRVASLFERGKGVAQDMATALLWYERAAAAGNIKAMHNAAVIAAGGKLGKPDYTRAFKWFSAAAAHGLKDSQFNLAVLYDRGLGTGPDPAEALFWYALAGRQNDADARKRAEAMMAALQPAAAAEMRRRIGAWTPKPSIQDANTVTVTDTDWKYEGAGETGSLPRAPGKFKSG
jgi:localization factor PodJL